MDEGIRYRLPILAGLAILVGVVGSFLILAILWYSVGSLGSGVFYFLVALAVLCMFAVYSFYIGFRRRNWATFTIVLTITGVLFLTSSSFAVLPVWNVHIYPWERVESVFNVTLALEPNETRTLERSHGYSVVWVNSSLVQVTMSSTQQVYVQIYTAIRPWFPLESVFNFTYLYGNYSGFHSYFWTPPEAVLARPFYGEADNWYWSDWTVFTVSLHNLGSSQAQVQMQIDVFEKTTKEVQTVNYRSMIDFQYAYVGIGLVGVSLIPVAYTALRRNNERTEESDSGKTVQQTLSA